MLAAFQEHIRQKALLDPSKTYLLACSGGVDSMVLGFLLMKSEIPIELAHVNFGLRGEDSNQDELFVIQWAEEHGITFHLHHPKTQEHAEEKKLSIQMAAREIRYSWFESLKQERNLEGIILAHHQDDQLETIFLNLLRGTGLDGIQGMADKKSGLIRPLLPFSKAEIEAFANENEIAWREDKSNQKTDYKRNKLRLEALPGLYAVSDDARQNLLGSFARMHDAGKALHGLVQDWLGKYLKTDKDTQTLPFHAFIHHSGANTLIFYWLRGFGFNSDQCEAIVTSAKSGESGKQFFSASHQLNVDREELLLAPQVENFQSIFIQEQDIEITLPEGTYELIKKPIGDKLDSSRENAMLDLEKLNFPFEIRTWQLGDRFIPLGMNHPKKVSDFLIDLKLPRIHKERVKVLISDGQIAWVIGHRIAEWAKCDGSTRTILHFKMKN
ncbi:tRNA lysidine(34) synthetase TilS [Algoriphagus kandeliae]|uniref:tRNA(Ile)-lysidine synthase n=1 Tax=Algoriphagus kandeliae TaxID=2562278 RepID=A0A4Y9QME0_9BACT|nr:tRNA lysidine(34) synthetase TilS [Algoriphagus kandeliae]TFV93357.1 tRNA lysidine(34) synthetase TilS [Algoriphagus kandeliae]